MQTACLELSQLDEQRTAPETFCAVISCSLHARSPTPFRRNRNSGVALMRRVIFSYQELFRAALSCHVLRDEPGEWRVMQSGSRRFAVTARLFAFTKDWLRYHETAKSVTTAKCSNVLPSHFPSKLRRETLVCRLVRHVLFFPSPPPLFQLKIYGLALCWT